GVISVHSALFIVLGSNIGTCVTALLACVGTGTNAKRTAFVHFIFNVIGSIIFTAVLWPTGDWFPNLLASWFPTSAFGPELAYQMQIAIFHVIFNVTTTLVLCAFVKQLERFSVLVIKDKNSSDADELKLKFVDERLLVTPAIAYDQVKKEIGYMATLAKENVVASLAEINNPTKEMPKTIFERENIINFTNKSLTDFLIKLTSEANQEDEKHIGACFHVINDLERIGDHAKNFLEISLELIEKELTLSQDAKDEVSYMASKVERMFELAIEVFEATSRPEACEVSAKLAELSMLEAETDKLKKDYISNHFSRLAEGKCDASHSPYYMSIVTRLERVADHLINVGYSIVNPTGSQA
ncbi:MAG: Na/Pi cotransporter family protein, partial [Clostridia bacterium]|nr:Na/Pi cotransporter family protein [Clostridia bacterium]